MRLCYPFHSPAPKGGGMINPGKVQAATQGELVEAEDKVAPDDIHQPRASEEIETGK